MKLYTGPLSLFSAKVRIALAEKGLEFEHVSVGWSPEQRYQPHHPEVIALNPKREGPVLVGLDHELPRRRTAPTCGVVILYCRIR